MGKGGEGKGKGGVKKGKGGVEKGKGDEWKGKGMEIRGKRRKGKAGRIGKKQRRGGEVRGRKGKKKQWKEREKHRNVRKTIVVYQGGKKSRENCLPHPGAKSFNLSRWSSTRSEKALCKLDLESSKKVQLILLEKKTRSKKYKSCSSKKKSPAFS